MDTDRPMKPGERVISRAVRAGNENKNLSPDRAEGLPDLVNILRQIMVVKPEELCGVSPVAQKLSGSG